MNDRDEVMTLAERATPRSEQRRSAWGSLQVALINDGRYCDKDRKCLRRPQHAGKCWPTGG